MVDDWTFPDKLPAFKPSTDVLRKVFKHTISLVTYAQYKRGHIVEKKEAPWLPHFALMFSGVIQDLRLAGKLSFKLAFEIWFHLWKQNPMFQGIGSHSDKKNFRKMVKAMMPFINGEKRLVAKESEIGEHYLEVQNVEERDEVDA